MRRAVFAFGGRRGDPAGAWSSSSTSSVVIGSPSSSSSNSIDRKSETHRYAVYVIFRRSDGRAPGLYLLSSPLTISASGFASASRHEYTTMRRRPTSTILILPVLTSSQNFVLPMSSICCARCGVTMTCLSFCFGLHLS